MNAWMDRMNGFGHGKEYATTVTEAYEHAKKSRTRTIKEKYRSSPYIDQVVLITPKDYRKVHTEGVLVGDFPNKSVLAKEHKSTERVHIHFPKHDFQIQYAPKSRR